MAEAHPELEAFRRKWREEVQQRTSSSSSSSSAKRTAIPRPSVSVSANPAVSQSIFKPPTRHPAADRKDEDDEDDVGPSGTEGKSFHDIPRNDGSRRLGTEEDDFVRDVDRQEPKSALEHYERAVEKESQGSLGDSLNLYRKAYKVASLTMVTFVT